MWLNLSIGITAVVVFFALAIFFKKPTGLLAAVFVLPLARPTVSSMSVVGLCIMAYLIGRVVTGRVGLRKLLSVPYKLHVYAILGYICFSVLILLTHTVPANIRFAGFLFNNVEDYFSASVAAIILYLLINCEVDSEKLWSASLRFFLWSGIYLVAIYVLVAVLHLGLPEVLSPTWTVKGDVSDRLWYTPVSSGYGNIFFSGFIGQVENFAEYLFVLFALAMTALLGRRQGRSHLVLCIGSILISVLMAFPTAVKAYPFMILFFVVPLVLVGTKGRNRAYLIGLLLVGTVAFLFFQEAISHSYLAKRFAVIGERYQSVKTLRMGSATGLAEILGRGDMVTQVGAALEAGGILGIGPLMVNTINGSGVPYHNLYYSLYLSFGAVGIVLYIGFFLRLIIDAWRYSRMDEHGRTTLLALAILVAVLLLEQFKVTAFRVPYGVLSYWFIAALISSRIRLSRIRHLAELKAAKTQTVRNETALSEAK